jgi:ADP-L-glycero-D-manno-heptose 6-epimerase
MIVITGGAGFIGSNLAAALEERGEHDLVVCDRLGRGEKWRNLAKRELAHIVPPEQLLDFLDGHARAINAVFHLGAISSTMESDLDAVIAANFTLSLSIWNWCARHGARLFYASSAATYGAAEAGFDDDGSPEALARLRPLNAYGWSKHLFDRRVARLVERGGARPAQWIGCKFFNVYGPNEYHKGDMRSVTGSFFRWLAGQLGTLRSYRPDVRTAAGSGLLHVRDCVTSCSGATTTRSTGFNVAAARAAAQQYRIRAWRGELLAEFVCRPPSSRSISISRKPGSTSPARARGRPPRSRTASPISCRHIRRADPYR